MRISEIRINGIREPMGFEMPYISLSWKVTESASRKSREARIAVAADPGFTKLLYEKKGESLRSAGERIPILLAPRIRYFCRVEVTGDTGDSAAADS